MARGQPRSQGSVRLRCIPGQGPASGGVCCTAFLGLASCLDPLPGGIGQPGSLELFLSPVSSVREPDLRRVHVCPPCPLPLGFQLLASFTLKGGLPSRDELGMFGAGREGRCQEYPGRGARCRTEGTLPSHLRRYRSRMAGSDPSSWIICVAGNF